MTHSRQVPWNRYVVFFGIALFGCALDLATKRWMFDLLGSPFEKPTFWVWEGVLGVTTSLNEGTLFSLGQGAAPLFAALSVIVCVGVTVWLFYYQAARDLPLTAALGCVAAGAMGNFYDRAGLSGLRWTYANALHQVGEPVHAVRDWIDFRLIHWPIFNIADSLIVCGTVVLSWRLMTDSVAAAREETESFAGDQRASVGG
ncbi:MAG: signal peptidase II [Planctomycetales bacterium]